MKLLHSEFKEFFESPNSFEAGVCAIAPLLIGTAPFGIIFGTFSINGGLSFLESQSMSVFVFAGSSQFIAVNLLKEGSSIALIVTTTLFINLRHFLYGATIGPKLLSKSLKDRVLLSFFLTDETFAILSRFERVHSRYYWGVGIAMYINWQLWTLIGIIFGRYLKTAISSNIGFVIVPVFIAIIVKQVNGKVALICGIFSGFLSLFLSDVPNQGNILLASIISISVTLVFESLVILKNNNQVK